MQGITFHDTAASFYDKKRLLLFFSDKIMLSGCSGLFYNLKQRNEKIMAVKSGKKHVVLIIVLSVAAVIAALIAGAYFYGMHKIKTAPKFYEVTTAYYDRGTSEDRENVEAALGTENTEENFRLYFQWYNVIHEMGHGLLRYNSSIKMDEVDEEQFANNFAVAYWNLYGDSEMLVKLKEITDYASVNVKNHPENTDYMNFGRENWDDESFFTFNKYGWFQFNSTKAALENNIDITSVLTDAGISGFSIPESPEKSDYSKIDEDTSTQILNDAVKNISSWGLEFPEVHHVFSNDPNSNFSRPMIILEGTEMPDLTKIN